jgi:hypothetical protein
VSSASAAGGSLRGARRLNSSISRRVTDGANSELPSATTLIAATLILRSVLEQEAAGPGRSAP